MADLDLGDVDLAQKILRLARKIPLKITLAESCTGGLLAGAITEIPGASEIFDCGYVVYSNPAKVDLLGVKSPLLDQHGAVSEIVAGAMARGALKKSGAGLALAVTGIAGPGGSDNKPEGRVCFALARTGCPIHTETVEFSAIGRARVRAGAVSHGLRMIIAALT